jgi:hypothetical protein
MQSLFQCLFGLVMPSLTHLPFPSTHNQCCTQILSGLRGGSLRQKAILLLLTKKAWMVRKLRGETPKFQVRTAVVAELRERFPLLRGALMIMN